MKTVTGKVKHLEHLRPSANGNPRYKITLDNGKTYQLQSDAALGYGIANSEYRTRNHTFVLSDSGKIERDL